MDPCVSVISENEAVYVTIHQLPDTRITVDERQFSGLVYMLKAIEKQFMEDRRIKEANAAFTLLEQGNDLHVETYDPCNSAINHTPIQKKVVLRDIYVEMFVERFKKMISEKCTGCCMGSQNARDHIICKLKKKDQILHVFDEIDMEITDNGMLEYIERNGGVYAEAIDKHSLMSTVVIKRKLVNSIEKCV